jgi:outer membrane immunogenic protein
MKRIFIALAAALCATAAVAADLPSRKSAPAFVAPPPVYDWTGFYIGAQGGYGWGAQTMPLAYYQNGWLVAPGEGEVPVPTFAPYDYSSGARAFVNASGAFAGGVIGYNQQIGSRFVVGVDGDFNVRIGGHGATATFVMPTAGVMPTIGTIGSTWNWASTIDGRAGFLVLPNLMLYARGGLALVQTSGNIGVADLYTLSQGWGSTGKVFAGWNVGGGVEYKITPNLSAKIQYTHIDLGAHYVRVNGVAWGAAAPALYDQLAYVGKSHPREDAVTVGVNYQLPPLFGASAPVISTK